MRWVMPYIDEVTWARWDGLAAFAPKPVVVLAGLLAGMSVFCLTPFTLFLYAIFIAVVDLVQDRMVSGGPHLSYQHGDHRQLFAPTVFRLIILEVLGLCFALLRRRTFAFGPVPAVFPSVVSWEDYWLPLLVTCSTSGLWCLWRCAFDLGVGYSFSGPLLNWYLRTVHSLLLVLISGRSWEFSARRRQDGFRSCLRLDQINLVRARGHSATGSDADLMPPICDGPKTYCCPCRGCGGEAHQSPRDFGSLRCKAGPGEPGPDRQARRY